MHDLWRFSCSTGIEAQHAGAAKNDCPTLRPVHDSGLDYSVETIMYTWMGNRPVLARIVANTHTKKKKKTWQTKPSWLQERGCLEGGYRPRVDEPCSFEPSPRALESMWSGMNRLAERTIKAIASSIGQLLCRVRDQISEATLVALKFGWLVLGSWSRCCVCSTKLPLRFYNSHAPS